MEKLKKIFELIASLPEETQKELLESFERRMKTEEFNAHQKIYNMELHQVIDLATLDYDYRPFRYIMRVPGGWIYSNYNIDSDKVFVPFDNDMQKVDLPHIKS